MLDMLLPLSDDTLILLSCAGYPHAADCQPMGSNVSLYIVTGCGCDIPAPSHAAVARQLVQTAAVPAADPAAETADA